MKKKILIVEVLDFELTRGVLTKSTTTYDEIHIFISNHIANSISLDLTLVQEAIKDNKLSFIEITKIKSHDVPAFMFFKIGGICSDMSMGSIVDLISEDFEFFNNLRVFLGKESIDVYLIGKLNDESTCSVGKLADRDINHKPSSEPKTILNSLNTSKSSIKHVDVSSEPLIDDILLEFETSQDLEVVEKIDSNNDLELKSSIKHVDVSSEPLIDDILLEFEISQDLEAVEKIDSNNDLELKSSIKHVDVSSEPLIDDVPLEFETSQDLEVVEKNDSNNDLELKSSIKHVDASSESLLDDILLEFETSQDLEAVEKNDSNNDYFFRGITEFNEDSCLKYNAISGAIDKRYFHTLMGWLGIYVKKVLENNENDSLTSEELIFKNKMSKDEIFISIIYFALIILRNRRPKSLESFCDMVKFRYKSIRYGSLLQLIALHFKEMKVCRIQSSSKKKLIINTQKTNQMINSLENYIHNDVKILASYTSSKLRKPTLIMQ